MREEAFGDALPIQTTYESFALVGLAYTPIPAVHLMPNLLWGRADGADEADLQARFTVEVDF